MRAAAVVLVAALSAVLGVVAQECDNGASNNGTSCVCPPGFGGSDCALPACGGNLFEGSQRTYQQPTGGKPYANISSCACEDGWAGAGTGCNGAYARPP